MSIQTDDFAAGPALARRVVSAAPASPNEEAIERALRPKGLQEYVGQAKAREQLEIFIGAAKKRGEALDHVLLFGPPGLGKTTLSHIIAHELGVNLRQTSGPVLEKPKDLAAILTNLERNDVLFIDEIHRLSPVVEEILYPALEDYQIDIMIGEGPAARSIKLELQPFTLVGATTRAGMLTNPLRDRFGIVARLEFYTPEELARIVAPLGGAARACRPTPTARSRSRAARAARRASPTGCCAACATTPRSRATAASTTALADRALTMLDVDPQGFDVMDRKLLEAVIHRFDGGPVGLDNVAAAIGEERGTIEDVIEPYLIQQGYLQRTPRGRIATLAAYRHLGLAPPPARGAAVRDLIQRLAAALGSISASVGSGRGAARTARPRRTGRRRSARRHRSAAPAAACATYQRKSDVAPSSATNSSAAARCARRRQWRVETLHARAMSKGGLGKRAATSAGRQPGGLNQTRSLSRQRARMPAVARQRGVDLEVGPQRVPAAQRAARAVDAGLVVVLSLEGAEQAVPDDQDAAVVAVEVAVVDGVVHAVVARRAEPAVEPAELADLLGVDPDTGRAGRSARPPRTPAAESRARPSAGRRSSRRASRCRSGAARSTRL